MLMAFPKELEASAGILEEPQNCLSSLLLSYLGQVPYSSLLLPGMCPRKIHTFHTRSEVELLVSVFFQMERGGKTGSLAMRNSPSNKILMMACQLHLFFIKFVCRPSCCPN